MIQDIMDFLSQADPEVGASIQKEFDREQHNIELIASENIVSKAVLLAMGTCLTNKYAEGYPGKRYYGGCYAVDVTEELARQRGLSALRIDTYRLNLRMQALILSRGFTKVGEIRLHGRPLPYPCFEKALN